MTRGETVLIGLGANLPSARHGAPRATLAAALDRFAAAGIAVLARSGWYETAPVPASDQPWYVNAVAVVATTLDPAALLLALHGIEAEIGRVRSTPNAPRAVDLDLLAYGTRIAVPPAWPVLPHPRLHERAFVLRPLAEVAPLWRHPVSGAGVEALLAALEPGQVARPLDAPE